MPTISPDTQNTKRWITDMLQPLKLRTGFVYLSLTSLQRRGRRRKTSYSNT